MFSNFTVALRGILFNAMLLMPLLPGAFRPFMACMMVVISMHEAGSCGCGGVLLIRHISFHFIFKFIVQNRKS